MLLLPFKNDVVFIRDLLPDGSNLLLKVIKQLIFVSFLLNKECCDDEYELLFVRNRQWAQVPVIDDECQMVAHLYEVSNFLAVSESFSHDCDEHV